MDQVVRKWNWPIWNMEEVYQLVPKSYWPIQDVAETY